MIQSRAKALIAASALLLSPSGAAIAQNTGDEDAASVNPLIVGGTPVANIGGISATPYQVALVRSETRSQFCGGTLVAPTWVLTAAHCVDNFIVQNDPERLDIIAGTLTYTSGGEQISVTAIEVHPNWEQTGSQFDFDAALLQLESSSQLGEPLTLMEPDAELPVGPEVRVSGWGAIFEGGPGSNELLFVDVPVVSNEECNEPESYDGRVTDAMFCAGARLGGLDSCQGDSGGPVNGLIDGESRAVGIVSWGFGCAQALKYGVYTRVSEVSDWAADTMGSTK